MIFNFRLIILLCIISVSSQAQEKQTTLVNIGDPAPLLNVKEWIKGKPINTFEKGNVYVIEFWATWCKPCIAAMPHISDLARKYRNKVKVIGIDILEEKSHTSIEQVKAFVGSMGNRMDYAVATQEGKLMQTNWLDNTGEWPMHGIPRTFVVNEEGRLAWIGHPKYLGEVLPKIVNHKWDIKEALTKRNSDRYLEMMDDSLSFELLKYCDISNSDVLIKPDSALLTINEIIKQEPKLKYAPIVGSYTFCALLKTNLHKAYEFGKEVLVTPTYEEPSYSCIIDNIERCSYKLSLPYEIYELGAEAYQVKINQIPYPEIVDNDYKDYNKMADWYWRANNKSKAIDAQEKAIAALKMKKDVSKTDMAAFESRLKKYKNM